MKRIIIEKKNTWNFEEYTGTYNRSSELSMAITIYKTGSFVLSAAFIHQTKSELDDINFAKFFYDKNSHSIGIKFTNDEYEIGISKITSKKYPNRSFSAKKFINQYSLNLKKIAGRYKPTREFINGKIGHLWVISLRDKKDENK